MPFKLDLPTKTGSFGWARRVLERIGEEMKELQHRICEDWQIITTIRGQQERDDAAWAAVRKYSLCQVEITLHELWALTNLLSDYAWEAAAELGRRDDKERVRLFGRFSYFDQHVSDKVANAGAKGILRRAREMRDECLSALDGTEAAEAKRIWLKEEGVRKQRAIKLMEGRLSAE